MRRKGICAISLCLMLGLMTACGDGISVKIDVDTKNGSTESDTSGDTEQGVNDTETEVQSADETDNQTTDAAVPDFKTITEEQCRVEIETLRANDPVNPSDREVLVEMAKCATVAMILDEKGGMFKEMDAGKRNSLRIQAYKEIMWSEGAFRGAITIEDGDDRFDADKAIPASEAISFFKDMYGDEDFTAGEHYEQIEDGYVLFSFGDGDPWELIEHMQFYEDDNYYLLTGPSFYEDNGGSVEYRGYADILFAKNSESRYGVTMLYGRYRNEVIKVASVATSSELPPANGKYYGGFNLIDGQYETAWVEGVDGVGIGESITLHLDKEQQVYGIQLFNGYLADGDLHEKNGKVTEVRVDFGGGNIVERQTFGFGGADMSGSYLVSNNLNKIELDEPVVTDTITITITDAEPGYKYDDTCISEIKVY